MSEPEWCGALMSISHMMGAFMSELVYDAEHGTALMAVTIHSHPHSTPPPGGLPVSSGALAD